jgi:hypothetical protein
MSAVTTRQPPETPEPTSDTADPTPVTGHRWPMWTLVTAGGLVVAWALPLATHRVGVDWVLPLAIVGLTASLLRSGRSALDRLVLACALLIGATCAAGLVISRWPWGLAPVPVAGTALSALVLVAALLRRRPSLPLTPRGSDLLAVASGLLAAAVVALPYLGRDLTGRMALAALGEDLARHFSLYDAIRIVDGYAFFDRHQSDAYLLPGLQTYPQGSHFLYALLDSFLRSGAEPGSALNAFNHYIGYHIAGYAFFGVVMLWAVRWVAGPALTGWPKAAIYTFVAAAVSFSELVAMFIRGYPSEILGLALFAVLLALLARPPRHTRELIVTVAALLVGIAWVYFFLLPMAGLVAVASLVGFRHRVLPYWPTVLVSALVAVPLAVTPVLVMYADRASPLEDLLPGGPVEGVDRGLTVGLAAVLLAGLATVPRSPVWRTVGTQLVIVATISITLGLYQIASIGHLSYYFDKSVHALFVTCLVGLSGINPLLAKLRRPEPHAGRSALPERRTGGRWVRDVAVAGLVCFAILATFGAVPLQRPSAEGVEPLRNVSWGLSHAMGNLQNLGVGRVIGEVLERYPESDGRLTQIVFDGPGASYLSSLFVSVLHRDYGTLHHRPKADAPLYKAKELHRVKVLDYQGPRRIVVVNSPETADALRTVLATRPDLDAEVVEIRIRNVWG